MTEPLTPADCDLRDFPFMPLDVLRLRDSGLAARATGDEFRAAVLLWCASWHQVPAASLPNDDVDLANLCGYGRAMKEWRQIRDGALRGWVQCDDGRLYHPTVSQKAREAWRGKLEQRWKTECARLKKHCQRHEIPFTPPDFDDWIEAGRPQGQRLIVPGTQQECPRDNAEMSQGQNSNVPETKPPCPPTVPRETHSKRKGKGKGQGQGQELLTHEPPSASLQVVGAQTGAAGSEAPGEPPEHEGSAGDDEPMPPGVPACPHGAIRQLWADVLPHLPQHRIWTETRRRHLQARWRETAVEKGWTEQAQGLEYFRRLFRYVGQSKFLTGNGVPQPGRPPFVCELEWLLLPGNWAKTIEGKFHQEAA